MASLHYLTIQDVLWINLQITKKVEQFDYARLEEAVFYQYAYGDSTTLLPQAGRFVEGFLKMQPFSAGNESTAFLSCAAFLEINGCSVQVNQPQQWVQRVASGELSGLQAVENVFEPAGEAHHGLVPDIRAAIKNLLDAHPELIGEPPIEKSA